MQSWVSSILFGPQMERLIQPFTKQKAVPFLILIHLCLLKVLFYLNLLRSPTATQSYYRKSPPGAGSHSPLEPSR